MDHATALERLFEARQLLGRVEIALHRISGHANITGEQARKIADEAIALIGKHNLRRSQSACIPGGLRDKD